LCDRQDYVTEKSDTIGNRARDLPACSVVPLPLRYRTPLPKTVNKDNNIVRFADGTGIITTDSNKSIFNMNINQTFQDINTWLNVNLLTLNVSKIQYLEFRTKNYYNVKTQITYGQKCITNTADTKFIGLIINTLSRKQHIEQLVSKMSSACYPLRNIKHMVPLDILRIIYFAHIHSIISYDIIFGGSSSYTNKVFLLQNKIIRIIINTKLRHSCRKLFKNLEIMTLYS
jgi:hypothetical protein